MAAIASLKGWQTLKYRGGGTERFLRTVSRMVRQSRGTLTVGLRVIANTRGGKLPVK